MSHFFDFCVDIFAPEDLAQFEIFSAIISKILMVVKLFFSFVKTQTSLANRQCSIIGIAQMYPTYFIEWNFKKCDR